jgi:hypothetical protein
MKPVVLKVLLLLAVAAVPFIAVVHFAGGETHGRQPQQPKAAKVPTAAQFAVIFVATTNRYAVQHHQPDRVGRAHCVPGHPGHYMCSYVVTRPGRQPECHLMQAGYTPGAASAITVFLSGRTARCRTLKEALDSLR